MGARSSSSTSARMASGDERGACGAQRLERRLERRRVLLGDEAVDVAGHLPDLGRQPAQVAEHLRRVLRRGAPAAVHQQARARAHAHRGETGEAAQPGLGECGVPPSSSAGGVGPNEGRGKLGYAAWMKPHLLLFAVLAAAACSSSSPAPSAPAPPSAQRRRCARDGRRRRRPDTWANWGQGFFTRYCVECHCVSDPKGLDFGVQATVVANKDTIRCGVAAHAGPELELRVDRRLREAVSNQRLGGDQPQAERRRACPRRRVDRRGLPVVPPLTARRRGTSSGTRGGRRSRSPSSCTSRDAEPARSRCRGRTTSSAPRRGPARWRSAPPCRRRPA